MPSEEFLASLGLTRAATVAIDAKRGACICPAMTGAAGTLAGKYLPCLTCGVTRRCMILRRLPPV